MKITVKSYGKIHSTDIDHDDLTIDQYIEVVIGLLVCAGFNRELIIEHLNQTE